jgi:transposase
MKSVSGLLDTTREKMEFKTVRTTPSAFHELLTELEPDRIVIEIGPTAGWICDLANALAIPIEVANTNEDAWRWRKVKKKTDRVDTEKLARLSVSGDLKTVHVPKPAVRQWREMIEYRKALVGRRTAVKNSIRSILVRRALKMPVGKSGWTKKVLAELRTLADGGQELWRVTLHEELKQLASLEASIRETVARLDERAKGDERVELLRSIPCVGPRLSEAIVAIIDDPHRFRRGRQLAGYVGFDPKTYQSGTMHRQGRCSRAGNGTLRSLLVQVAWLGIRKNPWMRQVYDRVRRGSKTRTKIAIVAVARRLLIRCWAMLRDGARWRAPSSAALRLAA